LLLAFATTVVLAFGPGGTHDQIFFVPNTICVLENLENGASSSTEIGLFQ
jgi:hypothetical protein